MNKRKCDTRIAYYTTTRDTFAYKGNNCANSLDKMRNYSQIAHNSRRKVVKFHVHERIILHVKYATSSLLTLIFSLF